VVLFQSQLVQVEQLELQVQLQLFQVLPQLVEVMEVFHITQERVEQMQLVTEDLVVVQVIGPLQLVLLDQEILLLQILLKEILVLVLVSVVVEVVELLLQEAVDLPQ
tara:strand:- start:301 stop:621 length:321 start_codon:yes stop_codon:yes gene_type:complete